MRRNNPTRIILHIGTTKTGSKAIESFLIQNNERLKSNGILYYEPLYTFMRYPNSNNILPNAFFLKRLSRHDLVDYIPDSKELFEKETEHLFETIKKYSVVILSYEVLWSYSKYIDFLTLLKRYFDKNRLSDITLEILVYLRRQDEYLISSYNEHIKRIGSITFDENFDEERSNMDYNNNLKNLESIFGIDNIKVRIYDRNLFKDNDIFHDFLDAIDVEFDNYEISNDRVNISLSDSVTYAMNRYIHYFSGLFNHYPQYRDKLVRIAYDLSEKYPGRKDESLIDANKRKMILDMYRPGNKEVSKRYFNREKLFDETIYQKKKFRISWFKCLYIQLQFLLLSIFKKYN